MRSVKSFLRVSHIFPVTVNQNLSKVEVFEFFATATGFEIGFTNRTQKTTQQWLCNPWSTAVVYPGMLPGQTGRLLRFKVEGKVLIF